MSNIDWSTRIGTRPYSECLIIDQENINYSKDQYWPIYEQALNTYLRSQDRNDTLSERYDRLVESCNSFRQLSEQGDSHIATRLALIRIYIDLGDAEAVEKECRHLLKLLDSLPKDEKVELNRPFLVPLIDYERDSSKEGVNRWLQAMIREVLKRNKNSEIIVHTKTRRTKSLDLGCGSQIRNPFNADDLMGVDVRHDADTDQVRIADLAIDPIPFQSDLFDYVVAYDFLEHIPRILYVPNRRNSFVELMNEIHRVLRPGGQFLSVTPAYPKAAAFQDPTHVNIITEQTFPLYFDHVNRWATIYGFKGAFLILEQKWQGVHLVTLMQKVSL